MSTLPRMRSPHNAFMELKQTDPQTELTEIGLRRLIRAGEIPSVRVGAKYLVNMDTLYEYLSGSLSDPKEETKNIIPLYGKEVQR